MKIKKEKIKIPRKPPKQRKPMGLGTQVHESKDRKHIDKEHRNEIRDALENYDKKSE